MTQTAERRAIPSRLRHFLGEPQIRMQANIVPPVGSHGTFGRVGRLALAAVAAVVEIVRVAVTGAVPVTFAGLVEPKLNVGGSMAPLGLAIMAAVSVTAPVNPPAGVNVIVEVLPIVAPRVIVTEVPVMEKAGGGRLMV
jgi:hypothetical protein